MSPASTADGPEWLGELSGEAEAARMADGRILTAPRDHRRRVDCRVQSAS